MGTRKLVFTTPIPAGKTNLLKEFPFTAEEEHLFFSQLGITKYRRWIQKIHDEEFLIHLVEGTDPAHSFKLLREKIIQNDPAALKLQHYYKDSLEMDIGRKAFFPNYFELTSLLSIDIENKGDSPVKEYCFIYPLIPSKLHKLLKMYREKAVYHSEEIQEILRFRGISKNQLWVQESGERSFIVIYQEITGPVVDARNKYLSTKEDAHSNYIAKEFSDITGLSYEDLLPKLESLFDSEILN